MDKLKKFKKEKKHEEKVFNYDEKGNIIDTSGHVVKKWKAILKLILLLVIIIGVPAYLYFYNRDIISGMSSVETLEIMLEDYKWLGFIVLICLQAVQILISIIPGQWIQIAGAYAWGFGIATLLSVVGAVVGTVVTYYISKFLGRDALFLFFGEKKMNHFIDILNSKKAMIFVAVIYFVPGIPKDLCNYAAGISSMNIKLFLVTSIIARTPPMMISILVGVQLQEQNYLTVGIIVVIMVIIFILGACYRKKIYNFVDRLYDFLMNPNIKEKTNFYKRNKEEGDNDDKNNYNK